MSDFVAGDRRTGNGRQDKSRNELAEDWAGARLDGDVGSLEEVLADDFVAVGARGYVLTGEQWMPFTGWVALGTGRSGWTRRRLPPPTRTRRY